MSGVVIATFALDRAILAGFMVYIGAALVTRTRPNVYMVVSASLLILGIILENG